MKSLRQTFFCFLLPIVCFAVLTWGWLTLFPQDAITVSIRLKTQKRFNLSVYYCDEAGDKFNERNEVSQNLADGGWKECNFRIPKRHISRVRFDFGNNPGLVEVSEIKLCGTKPHILDLNSFTFSRDVESHSVTDGNVLVVWSGKVDPYMVYSLPLSVAAAFMPERSIVPWLALIGVFALLLSAALEELCALRFCKRESVQTGNPAFQAFPVSADASNKIRNLAFICSVFVVLMHVSPGYRPQPVGSLAWWLFSPFQITEIAVPFFFLVSGYLLAGHCCEKNWFRSVLSKRVTTLLVPFVLWSLVYVVFKAVMSCTFGNDTFPHAVGALIRTSEYLGLNPLRHPMHGPLWYVRALLFLVVISPICLWALVRRKRGVLVGMFVFSVFSPNYSGCAESFSYTLFYFFGFKSMFYFLLGMSLRLELLKVPNGFLVNVLGLCGIAAPFICRVVALFPALATTMTTSFGNIPLHLLTPFMICFMWIVVSRKPWPKWLTGMAFPIYIVHWFVLDIRKQFFFSNCETFCQTLSQWGLTLALTICIVAILSFLPKKMRDVLFGGR